jgi:precorrin-2 dehydrogenase/sirohydrochlorin ferrochelatase
MYPLFLNCTGRLCLVVGGGTVGRRKAAALLQAGARVRLVCLEPRPAEAASPQLDWRTEPYRREHLDGAVLAFAAATREVNRQVAADAAGCRIPVNIADDRNGSDFLVPSVIRRGNFVLAVSTGGASPALARSVRTWLERRLDEAFGDWVTLLGELRPVIQKEVTDPQQRRRLFESLCHPRWLRRLHRQGPERTREAMHAAVRAVARGADDPL